MCSEFVLTPMMVLIPLIIVAIAALAYWTQTRAEKAIEPHVKFLEELRAERALTQAKRELGIW